LSVDPFRLYPGSPIDAERGEYERRFGTRFHRPHWWEDGDPEFLSEWVDPSAQLDYLERERLQHELLNPLLAQIEANFVYTGPARDYFLRAIHEQVELSRADTRLHYLGRYFAWQRYLGRRARSDRERREHGPLIALAREEREGRRAQIAAQAELPADHPILDAIVELPRERFVPTDQIAESVRDEALALDDSGLATISAMHAYARSFSLLEVGAGDSVIDLGAGTGYGAALLGRLVGARGRVLALELDPALVEQGRKNLDELGLTAVQWRCADACSPESWAAFGAGPVKLTVGFALDELPESWAGAVALGSRIVAPLRDGEGRLRLTRLTRGAEGFESERFEEVLYVPTRRAITAEPPREQPARAEAPPTTRLPVVT
jgi:protein-L-isoaspartate(D-aspartate) O-methyltransferase